MLAIGTICLWSGSIASIPPGWHLCDGAAGTPNLRDRFLVGAGSGFAVAATGGSNIHTHTGTTDGHKHDIAGPPDQFTAGAGFDDETSLNTDTFTTDPAGHLPPYYALAYIMRI